MLLKYLWALPCSLLGSLFGLLILLLGGSVNNVHGVLEFSLNNRWPARHCHFSALTLGHTILGVDHNCLNCLRHHEHIHVRQYEQWGIFFLLAYPLSSLWQLLRGRKPYWDNHFERDARERSGELSSEAQPTTQTNVPPAL